MALASGAGVAAVTAAPEPTPDFALRSAAIYRLEVGGAFFVALYLVAMAIVLALSGRGFAELGPQGLRAAEISGNANEAEEDVLKGLIDTNQELITKLATLQSPSRAEDKRLPAQEEP
jgi:hypothetical protein